MKFSIRGRIRAFQLMVALGVLGLAGLALVDLVVIQTYLARTQVIRQQLSAISQLAIDANRYSEQIAELLLVGASERPDLNSARTDVYRSFTNLRAVTTREVMALENSDEGTAERDELARLGRMQVLFREIDRAVERLLLLDGEGRRVQAVALFQSEIENRLDVEFERMIGEALTDERAEARSIEEQIIHLMKVLTIGTLSGAVVLLILTLAAGLAFSRSILRPIEALTKGTFAVERGDFHHRIDSFGIDEHAVLSRRFNSMAEQLGQQRRMLVEAKNSLEQLVQFRTEELAQANERLTAIDQQRVRLLADVSHELRTPLTALRGEAEVALRGPTKPEAVYRAALTEIVNRSVELNKLVEDLLFLARTEGEEILFHIGSLPLPRLLAEVTKEARVLAHDRKISINLTDAGNDTFVQADRRRLKQALLILLDNAIQYSEPSTTVEISSRQDGGRILISIRDHGPGIAENDAGQVFERFYRGQHARENWAGGTGLGLPIARWIASKHGGSIELCAAEGGGTRASIALPASTAS